MAEPEDLIAEGGEIVADAVDRSEALLRLALTADPTRLDAAESLTKLLRAARRHQDAKAVAQAAIEAFDGRASPGPVKDKVRRRLIFLSRAAGDDARELQYLEALSGADRDVSAHDALRMVELRSNGGQTERAWGVAAALEPSFDIVGAPDMRDLGDFAQQLIWLGSAKLHFERGRLTVATGALPGPLQDLLACCPFVDEVLVSAAEDLEGVVNRRSQRADLSFDRIKLSRRSSSLERIEQRARFVIPAKLCDALQSRLIELGVHPERWIATMNFRQDTGSGDALEKIPDIDPLTFAATARYIVDELGGQVIWLGGSPAPPVAGLVSLADDLEMLQYYAIARSRFMVGTCGGPTVLGSAFGIPTFKSNATRNIGAWSADDLVLTRNVFTADGHIVSFGGDRAYRAMTSVLSSGNRAGTVVLHNTIEQLKFGVDIMHARTRKVAGWRDLQSPARVKRPPNKFPIEAYRPFANGQVVDLTHLVRAPSVRADGLFAR